jgi:glycerophosphoryl diester phosphodiesterase
MAAFSGGVESGGTKRVLWLVVTVCAVLTALVWMILPGESDAGQRAPFWGLNCAHRGLHTADKSVPENSLAAFTAAVDAGYGIELDIQLSRDGEVVVFHDDTLDRVCGVHGRVDGLDWAELRALPLHQTDQRIPLLAEVLALVDGRTPLIIELKTCKNWRGLCQKAWAILRRYDGDICVESFDPRIVWMFRRHVPGLLRGQLAAPPDAMGRGIKGVLVGLGLANCIGRPHFIAYRKGRRPLSVRLAMKFAMRVLWTIRPDDDYDRLEDEHDCLIFEFYRPLPRFADPLREPADNPGDRDYRGKREDEWVTKQPRRPAPANRPRSWPACGRSGWRANACGASSARSNTWRPWAGWGRWRPWCAVAS